jgi:hypothetical protein
MLGLNRSGNFANGNPITLPHTFGNPVTLPKNFGNPVTLPLNVGNPVTWTPSPAHFGNQVGGSTPRPTCGTPTFSLAGGIYTGTQSVTITSSNSSAIFYTLDGSTPTTSSTPYTGAITVAVSETIEAIGVAVGYNNSAVASAVYIINASTWEFSQVYDPGYMAVLTPTAYQYPVVKNQLLVVSHLAQAPGDSRTISDSLNSEWYLLPGCPVVSLKNSGQDFWVWYAIAPSSAPDIVTIGGSLPYDEVSIAAYTPSSGTAVLDAHGIGHGNPDAGVVSSGSATGTADLVLTFGSLNALGSPAAVAGYTVRSGGSGSGGPGSVFLGLADKIAVGSGIQTADWTTLVANSTAVACFKTI